MHFLQEIKGVNLWTLSCSRSEIPDSILQMSSSQYSYLFNGLFFHIPYQIGIVESVTFADGSQIDFFYCYCVFVPNGWARLKFSKDSNTGEYSLVNLESKAPWGLIQGTVDPYGNEWPFWPFKGSLKYILRGIRPTLNFSEKVAENFDHPEYQVYRDPK